MRSIRCVNFIFQGNPKVKKTLKALESQGISLYTVAAFPSVYKGRHIYGVRGDGYVIPHHPATKEGEDGLSVTVPSGPLAKLTSALHGAIFHRTFLEENNISAYFAEVAEEMLDKVAKEETKEKACRCVQDFWWNVRTQCRFI